MRIKDVIRFLTASSSCLLCGSLDNASLSTGLCRKCTQSVEKHYLINPAGPVCQRCGINLLSEEEFCLECREDECEIRNISLFPYRGTTKDIIQFYKFKGYKRLALYFALLINQSIKTNDLENYTLVPVPPERRKIFEKGWDQIELIMDELTRMGYKKADLLIKKNGKPQKTLTKEERLTWIEGRFTLKAGGKIPPSLLIVDDVFTTGATIRECYRVLKQGGAEDIRSLTIGRD